MTVYHGQYVSQPEIHQFRNNIGNNISTNSVWSTSFDKEVADILADDGQRCSGLCNALFQIDIDSNLQSAHFAPIQHISDFPDENELLRSMREKANDDVSIVAGA